MKSFFNKIDEIKKGEIGVRVYEDFFERSFIEELDELHSKISAKVQREDSKKVPFAFEENEKFTNLLKLIHDELGKFFINDFSPHFITSKFPLRLHADTGKDPDDIIGQNILIPINIFPRDKIAHTIIFKNRWYGPAAYFTSKKSDGYDHILKDINGEFVDIKDIQVLNERLNDCKDEELIEFSEGSFLVNRLFREKISKLLNSKRYNIRTNDHITIGKPFDIKIYEKYLTHQPYEDLRDLEIDTIYKWKLGDLLVWDRSLIHCSDNYIRNGLEYKTAIPLFSSNINKPAPRTKDSF